MAGSAGRQSSAVPLNRHAAALYRIVPCHERARLSAHASAVRVSAPPIGSGAGAQRAVQAARRTIPTPRPRPQSIPRQGQNSHAQATPANPTYAKGTSHEPARPTHRGQVRPGARGSCGALMRNHHWVSRGPDVILRCQSTIRRRPQPSAAERGRLEECTKKYAVVPRLGAVGTADCTTANQDPQPHQRPTPAQNRPLKPSLHTSWPPATGNVTRYFLSGCAKYTPGGGAYRRLLTSVSASARSSTPENAFTSTCRS
jgi:hypothetical protein